MSYTKTRNIVFPTQCVEKTTSLAFPTSGAWDVNATFNHIQTVHRSLTGERLANWRTIVEKGDNATTNLTAVAEELEYNSIPRTNPAWERWLSTDGVTKWYRVKAGDYWIVSNQPTDVMQAQDLDESFVDNLARAAFYKALKSQTRKFQGLVFLGELSETLHMLRRPAFGLQKLVKDFVDTLKKRKRSAPKQWKKNIGEIWLEQSFGWNPLIADSRDAVSAYKTLVDPNRQKTTRISAGRSKWYDTTSGLSPEFKEGWTWNGYHPIKARIVSASRKQRVTIRYRGAVRPQVEAPTWGTNMNLFGFSPQDFVPSLWELLPWSFLADYFTNVGEILDSVCTSASNVTYVNRSRIRETFFQSVKEFVASNVGQPGAGWKLIGSYYGNQGHVRTYRKEVTRTRDVGITPPTFQMNFNLTDGQLLNVAALLSQVGTDLHPQNKPRTWHR